MTARVQRRADSRGITLSLVSGAGLQIQGRGDALRLQQVRMNLLSTAIKCPPQGSMSVVTGMRGARLRLALQDSGMGREADPLQRSFRPFEQADSATTRRLAAPARAWPSPGAWCC